jgi:hypothetical protein
VDRAEPGAGEHRVSRLRDHRHIDGDPVAAPDAAVAQHVRHPAHLRMQFAVGDVALLGGVVALPDDRHLVAALARWRSMQLWATFVTPSSNQRIDTSPVSEPGPPKLALRIVVKGVNQSMRRPCRRQNPSGSRMLSSYMAR